MTVIITDNKFYKKEIFGVTQVKLIDDNNTLEIKEAPCFVWYISLHRNNIEVKIINE